MAVYNGGYLIRQAVESVLCQTFGDFEFIIIDDGSTDGTLEIINEFIDPRIKIISNPENIGLTRSLNIGLEAANGSFIARMDADDRSDPERFNTQMDFFANHADVGILGGGCRIVDETDTIIKHISMPEADLEIRLRSLTTNPFIHSSIMVRHEILKSHNLRYDENYRTSQDYELWCRVLQYTKGANIQAPLVSRVLHDRSVSLLDPSGQRGAQVKVGVRELSRIWEAHPFTEETYSHLLELQNAEFPLSKETERSRYELIGSYLDVLDHFFASTGNEKNAKKLYRKELTFLLTLAVRPPIGGGAMQLVGRLFRLYPAIGAELAKRLVCRFAGCRKTGLSA